MDCEKFDQHVIDALYDELDELTFAALKRHVEGCARCAEAWAGLRATREVGILPLEEPPADLEDRILGAVALAQNTVPLHKKVLRGLAWAGSHAMRPQLAMAALFFLVIGSSLLLLRARPGTLGPVRVSEVGAPAPEITSEQQQAAAAATAAPVAAAADAPAEAPAKVAAGPAPVSPVAAAEGKAKHEERALEQETGRTESGADARAALAEAIAVRDSSGCAAAVSKLDAVAVRFAGTQAAADAMWAEAGCYKQMGDRARAQQIFLALRSTGYRDRAQAELGDDNSNGYGNQQQVAGRAAAGAPAAAAPAAPKAAPRARSLADAQERAGADAAGAAGAGSKAAKRPAAPAAPASRARPAPVRSDAAF
ncbi:Fe-S oxidoreductase [Minicystis rosea]|nr:Fe-S oxidoreductase [Minicystis rosea]